MFSTRDNELAFRIAAANNDTAAMIKLHQNININAVADGEKSSRQTAAHRAAAGGHVKALRLLFNLGADFTLLDKNNKTPLELVADHDIKTKAFFAMIKDAEYALQKRIDFFTTATSDASFTAEEEALHEKNHRSLLEKLEAGPLRNKIHASYLIEAKKNHNYHINEAKQFIEEYDVCMIYVKHLESVKIIIENAIKTDKTYCACGDAAAISFAALALCKEIDYPVEQINILSRVKEDEGHACVVLGRDTRLPITDLTSLDNALIIDSLKRRIFFYEFVAHYKEDTVCKVMEHFDTMIGATNRQPKFPSVMKFPRTREMYAETIADLKKDCLHGMSSRCGLTETANTRQKRR